MIDTKEKTYHALSFAHCYPSLEGQTFRMVPTHTVFGEPAMMCCGCGSTNSFPEHLKCYNCHATLTPSTGKVTEIEARDIQIRTLKSSVAHDWDVQAMLFDLLAAYQRGERPVHPKNYEDPQKWLDNNKMLEKPGSEIAIVKEHWTAYGKTR